MVASAIEKEKNLGTAVIYNFVFLGAGYWYEGSRKLAAIVLMVLSAIGIFIVMNTGIGATILVLGPIHFFTWIITCLDMYIMFKKRKEQSTVKCPRCAEKIQKDAKFCIHCKTEIVPV